MRGFVLNDYAGPNALTLTDLPDPDVGDGVLIDIQAIGINFPDLLLTRGQHQSRPPLPVVPGCEIAGLVLQAPTDSGFVPGDGVAGFVWHGGYAERAVAPPGALMRLPAGADAMVGAGMIVNYHTSHFALHRRGRLRSGEAVLVLGAAGGIGTAAIQVAKGLGARLALGGVANEDQADVARAAGADDVIVLSEGFAQDVRALVDGHGVDIVVDPLGDWVSGEALRALAPEGRILVVGFAAGEIPTLRLNRLLLKNVDAVGVFWGAFIDDDATLMASTNSSLANMFDQGVLVPQIAERYAFEDLPHALERLGQGQIPGKAVVEVS